MVRNWSCVVTRKTLKLFTKMLSVSVAVTLAGSVIFGVKL